LSPEPNVELKDKHSESEDELNIEEFREGVKVRKRPNWAGKVPRAARKYAGPVADEPQFQLRAASSVHDTRYTQILRDWNNICKSALSSKRQRQAAEKMRVTHETVIYELI